MASPLRCSRSWRALRACRERPARPRGFTIVEIVVVMAIITLLLTTSVPLFSRFQAGQRLKRSVSDLSASLRTAQSQASTHRMEHTVVLNTGTGEFWIEDADGNLYDRHKRLLEGVKVLQVTGVDQEGDKTHFTFMTNGSIRRSGDGAIEVTLEGARQKTQSIIVNALTGSVRFQ